MTSTLFAPGTQQHHDWLVEHRARVYAGEIPIPAPKIFEHEAGHALGSVLFECRFAEVVALPEAQWQHGHAAGGARMNVTGGPWEGILLRGLVALWAGPLAEGHLVHSADDLDGIVQGTSRLPERKRGQPFTVAARLVHQYRPAVNVLAARLAETGRLTWDECVALIETVIPRGSRINL